MPGGDRTGPRGFGPMTGRRLGSCYGLQSGGWFSRGFGRFAGFGFGRGRGWRNRYYATGAPGWAEEQPGGDWWGPPSYQQRSPQEELGYLKEYTNRLEDELNALRARMAELEGGE